MARYYTCWEQSPQGCDVMHESHEAAERCCADHNRGCRAQGGYSARRIYSIEAESVAEARRKWSATDMLWLIRNPGGHIK